MMISPMVFGSETIKFVQNFHASLAEQEIGLSYSGEITQEITKTFSEMIDSGKYPNEEGMTQKRVHHVVVEFLQNMCKHTIHGNYGSDAGHGHGIIVVSRTPDHYIVTTANLVSSNDVPVIESKLSHLNTMSKDELKKEFKQAIRNARISDKGGAGLGFIDIIKRTGNGIDFQVEPQGGELPSLLVLASRIDRNSQSN